MQAADKKANLMRAEKYLTYALDYSKRHHVEDFEDSAILAAQLHELVTQQLDTLCQL